MNKDEYITQKIAEYEVAYEAKNGTPLPTHNRQTIRDYLSKEYDFEEQQAVREDGHTYPPVEGY